MNRLQLLFINMLFLVFICKLSGQKVAYQLPVVHSIDEAQQQPAVFIAPNGKKYNIEFWTDPNERVIGKPNISKTTINCNDNHFSGTDRKLAKTSDVSSNSYHSFKQIKNFFTQYKLPSDDSMQHKVTRTSPRISIEKEGVILDHVFLYAFKRESDNDYHLIIGDDSTFLHATLLNTEISGLSIPDNSTLDSARSGFLKALGINDKSCMSSYVVFVNNPVPIHIDGAVFYDIDHLPGTVGPVNGNISLRPRTSWEIHPIAKFKLR